MDTTGAEANRPENQHEETQPQQETPSPQDIVAQRLAEIEARQQSQQETSAEASPEEVQPGIDPDVESGQEAAAVAEKTDTMADATTEVADKPAAEEQPAAEAPLAEAPAAQAEELPAPTLPVAEKEAPAPISAAHEEEEEEEEVHTDYSALPLEELRQALQAVLKSGDARRKHKLIQEIQRHYESKFQLERQEALDRFKQEGGSDEDFAYHAPSEHQELEKLLTTYRDARYHERQNAEEQRQRNLEQKQSILNQLRQLVESAETKSSNDELKRLQSEWKSTGPVPAGEAQKLWDSYHALLDIFYNNRSIFFELKELDRKRNLDAKLVLVERAETLQNEESINKALVELRHLHEEWKNIGPVPNEQRDPIWERFIQASEKVHERRRAFQESRHTLEMENLAKKNALLQRLQEYQNFQTDRINEWRDKTDEIQKLKVEWDAAGLVPKEYAEEINKNFWGNYKAFFQHKNQFFKGLDEQKMQNLRLKTELCEEAESLKESTDWNATKEKLIQLQKKWKTIGRVPDKYSDKIWQRFRAACNEFFDRKQAQEQQRGEEIERLSAEKMELCDRIAETLSQPNAPASLPEFDSFVTQWRAMNSSGKRSSPKVEEKFLELIEKYLERVPGLSYEDRSEMMVKLQVERIKHSPDAAHKLQQKEHTIRREITQLQNDIQTLRTNIEFFAHSKNADKLREEYEGRISESQRRIEKLQHQLAAFRG